MDESELAVVPSVVLVVTCREIVPVVEVVSTSARNEVVVDARWGEVAEITALDVVADSVCAVDKVELMAR